jgi:hypothetical protein
LGKYPFSTPIYISAFIFSFSYFLLFTMMHISITPARHYPAPHRPSACDEAKDTVPPRGLTYAWQHRSLVACEGGSASPNTAFFVNGNAPRLHLRGKAASPFRLEPFQIGTSPA